MWFVLKRLVLGLALITLTSAILLFSDKNQRVAQSQLPRVATFQFATRPLMDECVAGVLDGLKSQGFSDGQSMKIEKFNAENDLPTANTIARLIIDRHYDLVITASTPCMQIFAGANEKGTVKHVFCAVTDPFGAGVGISREDPTKHPKHLARSGSFSCLAFSPDGALLALGRNSDASNSIELVAATSGETRGHLEPGSQVDALAFVSKDRLAARCLDGKTLAWDLARLSSPYIGDGKSGRGVLSSDGRTLALPAPDGTVRLERVQKSSSFQVAGSPISALAFQPGDGRLLVTANEGRTLALCDTDSGVCRQLGRLKSSVRQLAVSPDGMLIAVLGDDRTLTVVDRETGKSKWTVTREELPEVALFSCDGRILATGWGNNGLLVFDAADGALLNVLKR